MGTISEEILRIQGAKASLKTAIESKGVEVSDSALIDEYADYVDDIQQGGGGGTPIAVSKDVSDYTGGTSFNFLGQITGVNFPSGITSISSQAFYNCIGLTSVTIPNSVTSISNQAFYNCSGLTSLTIPNSVTSIGTYAFYNCSGLTSVTIGSGVTTIVDGVFQNCGLTSLTIPVTVTSIGNYTFNSCKNLTSVTIGSGVTSIGVTAFTNCTRLNSITINATTPPTLGSNALNNTNNCPIYVPAASVETYKAANNWSTYASRIFGYKAELTYANGDKYIIADNGSAILTDSEVDRGIEDDNDPHFKTNITSARLAYGIEEVDNNAFSECTGLTSITIPNTVTEIREQAFYGCTGLTSITIPNSVTTIGDSAFEGCTGLTSVIIVNGVTSIGNGAFNGCTGLTSITIPNSVMYIGHQAFGRCSNLSSIDIGSDVTDIGDDAFSYSAAESVTLRAVTPPIIYPNTFDGGIYIYVPAESVEDYSNDLSYDAYAIRAIPSA